MKNKRNIYVVEMDSQYINNPDWYFDFLVGLNSYTKTFSKRMIFLCCLMEWDPKIFWINMNYITDDGREKLNYL